MHQAGRVSNRYDHFARHAGRPVKRVVKSADRDATAAGCWSSRVARSAVQNPTIGDPKMAAACDAGGFTSTVARSASRGQQPKYCHATIVAPKPPKNMRPANRAPESAVPAVVSSETHRGPEGYTRQSIAGQRFLRKVQYRQDDAENDSETKRCLPVYGASSMNDDVPKKTHKDGNKQGYSEYGYRINE